MSEHVYSLLLRLYPRAFRERYAEEMLRLFEERLRDEHVLRVWLDVLVDAAVSIPRQHFRAQRAHPMFPPSAAPLRRAMVTNLLRSFLAGGGVSLCFLTALLFPTARPLAILMAP